MNNHVIQVENLSKRFYLRNTRHQGTLRDQMGQILKNTVRQVASIGRKADSEQEAANAFWALKDISFTIDEGEVVGLLGPNGSGKSTLLRILNRISRPTTGHFKIVGRLGSLLEVGTGFHPDLTGRENVYLNGAILGMTHHEISRKFDEIVHFAEIEKFIDTPSKFYSSGMYVRLAFSVAVHLDADVLLLDEVLGVGDQGFQRKSSEKVRSMVKDGRTVILVSHIMPHIQQMCTRVIWLNFGMLKADGKPEEIIPHYIQSFETDATPTG